MANYQENERMTDSQRIFRRRKISEESLKEEEEVGETLSIIEKLTLAGFEMFTPRHPTVVIQQEEDPNKSKSLNPEEDIPES
jgi:hypothetical protein